MGALSFPIEFLSGSGGVTEAALAAIDAWDSTAITASTYSAVAGESRKFTHATGCDVTLPTGAANGTIIAVRTGHATGYVKFVTGGGSSKVQTGTTQISGALGKVMVAQATETANEWNITGHDPEGAVYVGTYATYADLQTAYPKSGAALAALAPGSWAVVTELSCIFVPNVAKTNWRSQSGIVVFPGSAGSVATPLDTLTGVVGDTQWNITEPLIPANFLNTGDEVFPWMITDKTGAVGTSENKIRIGTSNNLTGASIINSASGTPANDFWNTPSLTVVSTTVGVSTRSMAANSAGTGNPTDITIATGSAQYVVYSSQVYGAADTVKLISYGLWVRQQP